MTGTASAGVVSAEMGKTNAEGDQTLGAAAEEAVAGNIVESPLVGTFYSAPAEDAESFVKENGMECCECGCCSYVCPAKRQLKQAIGSMRKTALANRKKK